MTSPALIIFFFVEYLPEDDRKKPEHVWELPRVCTLMHIVKIQFLEKKYIYIYRGADKSLARPGRKQTNVSVRMAWIFFCALPCRKKKTWWQLDFPCRWNRARRLICIISASVTSTGLQFGRWTNPSFQRHCSFCPTISGSMSDKRRISNHRKIMRSFIEMWGPFFGDIQGHYTRV